MIHVHIRDDEHRPTLDLGRLKDTVAALRESTDLVVQLSTGGSVHDPLEDRLQVLDAAAGLLQPDHGHHQLRRRRLPQPVAVRVRALPAAARSARWCRSSSCSTSARCTRCTGCSTSTGCRTAARCTVDLVMGVPGGMPGTADALVAAVAALPAAGDQLVGHRHRPLHAAGHARRAVQGRPPAGRHGGRAHHQPRRPGGAQRPARRAGRRGRPAGPADPDDARPRRAPSWPTGPERGAAPDRRTARRWVSCRC